MRLTHLYSNKVIIARMITTSGDKMAFSTVTSAIMSVQPINSSKAELADGVYGKTFRLHAEGGIDIRDGDRLRDMATGVYYTVKADGVSRRTYGSFDYSVIEVEKTK